jgi:hypothetical protein
LIPLGKEMEMTATRILAGLIASVAFSGSSFAAGFVFVEWPDGSEQEFVDGIPPDIALGERTWIHRFGRPPGGRIQGSL